MRTRHHVRCLALLGTMALAGCLERGAYVCASDAECVGGGGEAGRCEPSGYCSFADSGCPSGWRYGDLAPPAQAGECAASTSEADAPDDGAIADAPIDGMFADACVPTGPEICNGIDDNCNSVEDEGFPLGVACDGSDGDLCNEGVTVCNVAGDATVCDDMTNTNMELCNGIDDNCNTLMDEGYNVGMACDGSDSDACVEGALACNAMGTGTVCSDMTASTVETCNNLDDDCRNGIDDPWPLKGTSCTVGVGACARTGTWVCRTDGTGLTCNATPGTPGAEFCGDGVDSDCMGDADPSCPGNDLPSGAINVSPGGTFTADVRYAHDDASGGCSGSGGRDVFYQITVPAAEIVYLDAFGSNYDSVVRIHTGACSTSLGAQLTCNDNACSTTRSQLATRLTSGTWCIVVDQQSSAVTAGSLTLAVRRGGRDGTAFTGTDPTGDTCSGSDSSTSCIMGPGNDVGYYFTLCPTETRMLTAETCGSATWDTGLYLRSASATPDLACDDDIDCGPPAGLELQSSVGPVSIAGPDLFWVILDGYMGACGAYTIDITLQ